MRLKKAKMAENPSAACEPPPPTMPPDCNIGVTMKCEERSTRAADLIKAEALYLALRETNVYVKWDVREAFMTAFASSLTEMRMAK